MAIRPPGPGKSGAGERFLNNPGRIAMRLMTIAAFAGLLATAAHADTIAHCTAAWNAMAPAQKAANTATFYASRCRKADYNALPAVRTAPRLGAKALCKD